MGMKGHIQGVRRGFTLIELLVVVAIIMLLAGLLFPAFTTARETARKTKARADVKHLDLAFKAVVADRIIDQFASGDVNGAMVTALTGGKGVVYMEFDQGATNSAGFMDPWKRVYHVMLDKDGLGKVTVDGQDVPRQVAAWSDGPSVSDKQDDVCSWK